MSGIWLRDFFLISLISDFQIWNYSQHERTHPLCYRDDPNLKTGFSKLSCHIFRIRCVMSTTPCSHINRLTSIKYWFSFQWAIIHFLWFKKKNNKRFLKFFRIHGFHFLLNAKWIKIPNFWLVDFLWNFRFVTFPFLNFESSRTSPESPISSISNISLARKKFQKEIISFEH